MTDTKEEFDKLISQLPPFCKTYFAGVAEKTTVLTRINYARDILVFFRFLKEETEDFAGVEITNFKLPMIENVQSETIEQYLFFVSDYLSKNQNGITVDRVNDSRAKARKLSALSSMYKYFQRKKLIEKNPVEFVEKPKIREKAIIRLDPNEVANLLDAVESGEGQSERQKKYNAPLVIRDVAILTLFLGTGMRISELTGIDIDKVNFEERAILITRKGQKQDILYFGDEVAKALDDYMKVRNEMHPSEEDKKALFLSNQEKRISNRAVQNLVKKYAHIVTPLKHITPHKLRSTFGTTLYQETGDIYLVATVLGHNDVNTTKKHYAYQAEENKMRASKVIKLRSEHINNDEIEDKE